MSSFVSTTQGGNDSSDWRTHTSGSLPDLAEAESVLLDLAQVFFASGADQSCGQSLTENGPEPAVQGRPPTSKPSTAHFLSRFPQWCSWPISIAASVRRM